jgi:uncharacterized membrane protein
LLPDRRSRKVALIALGPFFVAAGGNHFLDPDFYLRMMPPSLPAPLGLVYLSGVLEIVGGVAVFVPKLRSIAGWGLVLLLVGVFPANVYMALHPEQFPEFAPILLWIRLPLQGLFIAWAYWATRPDRRGMEGPSTRPPLDPTTRR